MYKASDIFISVNKAYIFAVMHVFSSSTELSALKHAIETAIAEETSVSSTTTTTQLIPRDVASTTTATPLTK